MILLAGILAYIQRQSCS